MNSIVSKAVSENFVTQYKLFLELLPDSVFVIDRNGTIELANAQAHKLFGYPGQELLGQSIDILVPAAQRPSHAAHVAGYASRPKRRPMGAVMELTGCRKDGSEFPVDIMLGPLDFGQPACVICTVRDMTAFRKMQSDLQEALEREQIMARTDPLTGATNSRNFYQQLELEMERSRRNKRSFSVVYVDLDNFKQVNDQHGHSVGDAVLCCVASCVKDKSRKTDVFARLGGDEFALLLPETDDNEVRPVMKKVREALLAEMQRNGWPVTFSVGVLTCKEVPDSADMVIKRVDDLMYTVKRTSKNATLYSIHPNFC